MFKTFETVEGSDGTINAHGIEVLLEQEDGGQGRLAQKCVLPADAAEYDRVLHWPARYTLNA